MTNAISKIVRREIDSARNRNGMQAGLPKVTIEASHAEYLCKMAERIAELEAREQELVEAVWQVLDDMGKDGLCCCHAAKVQLRIAYEPFNDGDGEPDFTYESALAKLKAEIGDE